MGGRAMSEQSADGTEQITVECPHCGHRFETHDVGDIAGCEECRETFSRFKNIVDGRSADTEMSHNDGNEE